MGGLAHAKLSAVLLAAGDSGGAELAPAGYGWALLKMVAALGVVCVLAYALLRLARRYLTDGRGSAGLMRVVDRCPLSARQGLWLVEIAGRYFVVGASEGQLSRLAELEADQVERRLPAPRPASSFWAVLTRGGRDPAAAGPRGRRAEPHQPPADPAGRDGGEGEER